MKLKSWMQIYAAGRLLKNEYIDCCEKTKIEFCNADLHSYYVRNLFQYESLRNKIKILGRLSRKRFKNETNYFSRRAKQFTPEGECFCCTNRANVVHHMVSLINGGTNNPVNLLSLCRKCHKKIHPFIKDIIARYYKKDVNLKNT